RDGYVRGATSVAAPGATMLLFCFIRRNGRGFIGPQGIASGEIRERFRSGWSIAAEQAGRPMAGYDAAWYTLRHS
ncbi:MAG TPA: hypothetical protein VKE27_12515, partial [Candidatus Dormibacteraeota bacterium]|nr:hypothetical protein [Candidatus Dormibacteraeota bacterium]